MMEFAKHGLDLVSGQCNSNKKISVLFLVSNQLGKWSLSSFSKRTLTSNGNVNVNL